MPTAPHNLNYTDLTATGVTLTWRRPDPPNGLITQYNVSNTISAYSYSYYMCDNIHFHRYLTALQTHNVKCYTISPFSK